MLAQGYPLCNFVFNHKISQKHINLIDKINSISIPNSYKEAMLNINWVNAINNEMKA